MHPLSLWDLEPQHSIANVETLQRSFAGGVLAVVLHGGPVSASINGFMETTFTAPSFWKQAMHITIDSSEEDQPVSEDPLAPFCESGSLDLTSSLPSCFLHASRPCRRSCMTPLS